MPARSSNPYLVEMPDGSRIERTYCVEDGEKVPVGNWKWVVYDPDRTPSRKKVNLYTKDKGAATDKAKGYIKRMMVGLFDPWEDAPRQTGTTVDDAITPYFKSKRRAGGADSTIEKDENRLRGFAASLPVAMSMSGVTKKHVERFLDRASKRGGKLSNGAKNRDRATIRHFFEWAIANGMATLNPVAGIKPWKKEDNRRDHATGAEIEAILRAITAAEVKSGKSRQWLKDWLVFGFGSGLRPDELHHLRWSAVHLAERRVEVCLHHKGKTKKSRRTLHVAGDALAVLERRSSARTNGADGPVFTGAKGGPVNIGAATSRLTEFGVAAGIQKHVVSYGLRHGFGTRMTAAGKPVVDVARMMGTSVAMLEDHYAHYDPKRGAEHIEDVYGEKGPDPAEVAAKRERLELAAELHRAGRLTLAEAARVAELDTEVFAESIRAHDASPDVEAACE